MNIIANRRLLSALLASILVAGMLGSWWLTVRTECEMRKGLIGRARQAAKTVNVARIRALTCSAADLESPDYLRLKEQFAAIRASQADCRFIYLMGRKADGTVFFFADSEPAKSKDYSPPGQVYEEVPAEYLSVFETKIASVVGPVSDRWGTWVSALVQLTDPQSGKVLAVLGMDIDARDWKWNVAARAAWPVGVVVVVVLIGLLTALFVAGRVPASPKPIMRRLLPFLTVMFLALVAASAILLWRQHFNRVTGRTALVSGEVERDLKTALEQQAQGMATAVQLIAQDPRVRVSLSAKDEEHLLADWRGMFETLRREQAMSHFLFYDENRVCLLRVHKPEKRGDRIERFLTLEAERTGKPAWGIEMGSVGTAILRMVQPVFDNRQLVGYVELGKELEDILRGMQTPPGLDIAVSIKKDASRRQVYVDSMLMKGREADWERLPHSVIIYASQGHLPDAFAQLVEQDPLDDDYDATGRRITYGGRDWSVTLSPIADASGKEVGRLLAMNDITELKAAFKRDITLGGIAGVIILAALFGLTFVMLNHTDAGIRAQQAKLRESEEHLSATLRSIGDGVITCNTAGTVMNLNAAAETLTGWTSDEANGQPILEVFRIINAQTREMADNPVFRAIAAGVNIDLANHTALIAKDGTERQIADSCAPIKHASGTVSGAVLVFRDVTEEYRRREELRVSEERYRLLGDNAISGIALHKIVLDAAGRPLDYVFLSINPAFETHTGLKRADVLGRRITEVLPGGGKAPYVDIYGQVVLSGEPVCFEQYFEPLERHYAISAYRTGEGCFATIFEDITRRKRIEKYRKLSREILKILNDFSDLRSAIQCILTVLKTQIGVDAVGLRLQDGEDFPYFIQDGFSDEFLMTENSLLERGKDGGVCRDKDGNVRLECTCGLVISGKTDPSNPLFTNGGSCWTNDSFPLLDLPSDQDPRLHPRNNCIHQLYASIALIPLHNKDRIVGLIHLNFKRKGQFTLETVEMLEGIAADIGLALSRKRAEEALLKANERFMLAVTGSNDGIWDWNLSTNEVYLSPKWKQMLGYEDMELKNHFDSFIHLVFEDDLERVNEYVQRYLKGEFKEYAIQFRMKHKDGSLRWILSKGTAIRDRENRPFRMAGSHSDITEQKKTEAAIKAAKEHAEAASKAKSEFLTNMSHEIRTPLNGVIGGADLLRDTLLNSEQRHLADIICSSGKLLLQLVNDILDFSRIEAGNLKLDTAEFDLDELLKDLSGSLAFTAQSKNVELILAVAPEVPARLCGSSLRLQQVIINLAGNAVKFTDQGEVAIKVTLERETTDSVFIGFSVRDTGIGIAKDIQPFIFDAFFQADSTVHRKHGGTGLGLPISKGLVLRMGGELCFTSESGVGSEFSFILPFVRSANEKPPFPLGTEWRDARILVADNNATTRQALLQMLTAYSLHTVEATDGMTAIELLRQGQAEKNPFRAALIDCSMPGMTAAKLAKKIRSSAELAGIRLIALLPTGSRPEDEQLETAGFDRVVNKPVNRKELLEAIRSLSEAEPPVGLPALETGSPAVSLEQESDKMKILLAEDNPVNQKVMAIMLKKLGLQADIVQNGLEVLQKLSEENYHAVLMDIQMPELDGLEATLQIRDPKSPVLNHRTTIIAVTAHAIEGYQEVCRNAGMDDYISKPITLKQLREVLNRWLPIGWPANV